MKKRKGGREEERKGGREEEMNRLRIEDRGVRGGQSYNPTSHGRVPVLVEE